jgi:L-aspartate oxidase
MTELDTDVLVLGAGAAGLLTALNARERRVCVLWPGSDDSRHAASDLAQGGIAAAVGADDSPELHVEDTLEAGSRHNQVSTVKLVCRGAPAAVRYLSSFGVGFAREGREWSLHKEAAHSRARVLHVGGDATGAAIMQALRRQIATASHVETLPGTRAISLLRDTNGICGVAALSADGRPLIVHARDVVIATGGVGGMYSRSTNPLDACGDGPAMALAAGARCKDLEFVQFHPTALNVDVRPLPLMTEALRGAGARLVDDTNTPIMPAEHPLGDLAPRDVVARAIYAVQSAGGHVWLDATNLPLVSVAEAFPSISEICRTFDLDPDREPIPVTPAAHYHMGGVAVDLEGRTSLPRLWAVGEAACTGLHGANRLASNSLLEAVVFGRRAGRALNREPARRTGLALHTPPIEWDGLSDLSSLRELRELMWRRMGLVRSASGLAEALSFIRRLRERIPRQAVLRRARLLLAEHMVLAAVRRRTSCGAHYRCDSKISSAVSLEAS